MDNYAESEAKLQRFRVVPINKWKSYRYSIQPNAGEIGLLPK